MPFHSKTNWQKNFQNQNDKNTQIYMYKYMEGN